MKFPWPFKKKQVEKPDYYWKIIHWIYPDTMTAKEGYGIVFDQREEGKPYWKWKGNFPIFGFTVWRDNLYPEPTHDMLEIFSRCRLNEPDWVSFWNIEEHPSKEIIEGIKYGVYLHNKLGFIDNLSLIEILDKLNGYQAKI